MFEDYRALLKGMSREDKVIAAFYILRATVRVYWWYLRASWSDPAIVIRDVVTLLIGFGLGCLAIAALGIPFSPIYLFLGCLSGLLIIHAVNLACLARGYFMLKREQTDAAPRS